LKYGQISPPKKAAPSGAAFFGRKIDLRQKQWRGLSKRDYWNFWRRLLWADELGGKPIDVVRIEDNGFLVPIILDEGLEIYAEGQLCHGRSNEALKYCSQFHRRYT
jgi:hypothetical protein